MWETDQNSTEAREPFAKQKPCKFSKNTRNKGKMQEMHENCRNNKQEEIKKTQESKQRTKKARK